MTDGDELWWNFDQTDFVVSIALRDAREVPSNSFFAGPR